MLALPALLGALLASPLPAEPAPAERSALSIGAALLPGALVHGAGTWAGGDRPTARLLLGAEGLGLGLTLAGGLPVVLTGASRRVVGPGALAIVLGLGLVITSGEADLYGVLLGEAPRGAPEPLEPRFRAELGYRYVYDPEFRYRNFLFASGQGSVAFLTLGAEAWQDPVVLASRVRTSAAFRLLGRRPGEAGDDTHLDLRLALGYRSGGGEAFSAWAGEGALAGRLDLARVGSSLRGAFVEGEAGLGLEAYGWPGVHLDVGEDVDELLLARFGFGVYFGPGGGPQGEAQLYYDHRRDTLVGGLKVSGVGSGFAGHLGLAGRLYLTEHWGLAGLFELGSAYVGGLSLAWRGGA